MWALNASYSLYLIPQLILCEGSCPNILFCEVRITTDPKNQHFDQFFICCKLFTQLESLAIHISSPGFKSQLLRLRKFSPLNFLWKICCKNSSDIGKYKIAPRDPDKASSPQIPLQVYPWESFWKLMRKYWVINAEMGKMVSKSKNLLMASVHIVPCAFLLTCTDRQCNEVSFSNIKCN